MIGRNMYVFWRGAKSDHETSLLHDETHMTRLAIPTGCILGRTNGEDHSVERQRRCALSANQERVLSMIIPSSGFLDPCCLVLLPLEPSHRGATIAQSSDTEYKKDMLGAVQSPRQSLTCKGQGVICKAPLSMNGGSRGTCDKPLTGTEHERSTTTSTPAL